MTERRLKIVGRDTHPPSKQLQTREDVVAAYEAIYTELLHLGTLDSTEYGDRVKALSECRRCLADLLQVHDPEEGEGKVEEYNAKLKSLF